MTTPIETFDAVIHEIPTWTLTEADLPAFSPPMTVEQMEWFNRGVLSTAGMVEEMKKGNL